MNKSGKLFIIGLGPGDQNLLTRQALEAIEQAEVIIGYEGYFPWVAGLVEEKECIAFPLTQEVLRAELAVQRALEGDTVGIISSGDAGIYGMASIVLEVLERYPDRTEFLEVMVIPGVSAITACAALLGAPLGHDFAVISLSDLLTPWSVIEKRIDLAVQADFVLVILNPQSQKRTWQYARTREILLRYRAPDTPVGMVRNAYRPGQSITHTTIAQMCEMLVDMLTTVIVGNAHTRWIRPWLVTPRGYKVAASLKTL